MNTYVCRRCRAIAQILSFARRGRRQDSPPGLAYCALQKLGYISRPLISAALDSGWTPAREDEVISASKLGAPRKPRQAGANRVTANSIIDVVRLERVREMGGLK